jgi:glycosyltransferase involved in cell wall biosynthesis
MSKTVSIVTITQLKRFECLKILQNLIQNQTYTNIIEWVIIEGSRDKESAEINKNNIKSLTQGNIVYLEYKENRKLGELRNIANKACKGDITVCMDDDDYYPPTRVAHAVEKLNSSKALIAGCSALYVFDYFLGKLYKFKANKFGPNHSTNNCMAWKKEYLLKNEHDNSKETGEEASFTKKFTEPLVQLDAEHTIICSSHDGNTFNKRDLLVGGTLEINPTVEEIEDNFFIKLDYYEKYKNIFVKETDSKYDITYLAGGFSIKWDPKDLSLGGSEQAIVNLTREWVKMGKKVAVYGEVSECIFDGVDYYNWKTFPFEQKHNILILWRFYGIGCSLPFNVKANKIWADFHDNFTMPEFSKIFKKYGKKINTLFFKSNFHREEFEKCMKEKISPSRYVIIPNGIRVKEFSENKENIIRNPYRFIYCSCYMRGLKEILQFIWPIIYNNEPRSELHIYYGMNNINDDNVIKMFSYLLAQPGVMDHGRQPVEIVSREKHLSSFHLYVTNTSVEIDCISIRESLATGCIPIISNFGVFKEREGFHLDLEDGNIKSYQAIALKVLQLMENSNKLVEYRERIKKSPLLNDWKEIAERWLKN